MYVCCEAATSSVIVIVNDDRALGCDQPLYLIWAGFENDGRSLCAHIFGMGICEGHNFDNLSCFLLI